jgi:hypothetical protein
VLAHLAPVAQKNGNEIRRLDHRGARREWVDAYEAHNIHLDLSAMLTIIVAGLITTKGMGNVGGGGSIAATTVLVAMGLPVEAIAIIAGIDVFMDMGRADHGERHGQYRRRASRPQIREREG